MNMLSVLMNYNCYMTALSEGIRLVPYDGGVGNPPGWSKVWKELWSPEKRKFISKMLSLEIFSPIVSCVPPNLLFIHLENICWLLLLCKALC